MLSFSNDIGANNTFAGKLDMSMLNSMFTNTPSETKFSIGSFNYNPVSKASFSFIVPKKHKPSKKPKIG